MKVIRTNYPDMDLPAGPYVHSVRLENLLYISGLTAFGSEKQQGNISDQIHAIMEKIGTILQNEGETFASLMKVTIFVTNFDELESLRETLQFYYGENLPASSLVQVQGLFHPDLKIEIEAIAKVSPVPVS